MALTLLYIYNQVAGQAWSKFDGEVEEQDEFEETLLTSIQKALSALWCSYAFPFRIKTKKATVDGDTEYINMPAGNIHKKTINGAEKYCIRVVGGNYLEYQDDFETLELVSGKPTSFFIANERIYLYPQPDNEYEIHIDYLTLKLGTDKDGKAIYQLRNDTDTLNVPEKYEELFKNALITSSMCYAIAADQDENYANYLKQYKEAYRLLIEFTKGLEFTKKIVW